MRDMNCGVGGLYISTWVCAYMCAGVCMYVSAHTSRAQRLMLDDFLCRSLPCFLRQAFLDLKNVC